MNFTLTSQQTSSMARESFDYILNVEHRPNKTGVLLAIPMYMYRIETLRIEYGINFFQKAVLMFKTKPGIDNGTISNCLGLDRKLVDIVSEQLVAFKLVDAQGRLTEKGREMKDDIDGLIVDEKKKSIGYVFQHINDDGMYAFYVNNIKKATVIKGDICVGNKGETGDEDFYVKPFQADRLLYECVTNPAPDEREILGLIRRSNKHAHSNKDVETLHIDTNKYGISFVPNDHPTKVWVCMYAYVPRVNDDVYASEWEIQDPFGFENNSELKIYIESLLEDGLIDDFTENFKNLKTENDQTIDSFQAMMYDMVNEEMEKSFEIGYHNLDENLLKYLRMVVKNYLLLNRVRELDYCGAFIGNIQNALETIFKLDIENNAAIYQKLKNEFKFEYRRNGIRSDFYRPQQRYDYIEYLFNVDGLTADLVTERILKEMAYNFGTGSGKSLKHYLLRFLFAHKYNACNPLYDIIKGSVGVIYDIANQRNIGSHGSTSNEKQIRSLSSSEINKYYNVLKTIINNYIIQYNG